MKKIVFLFVLSLTFSAPTLACSYSFSHNSLGVLHRHSDLIFEGEVTAVYIGGKQISTSLFDKAVAKLWKTTEILFKVKPTKVYEGEPAEQYAIRSGFYTDTLCRGGLYGDVDQKLWAANIKNGRLEYDPFYYRYFDALQTVEKYRRTLTYGIEISPPSSATVRLLSRDLNALEAFKNGSLPSLSAAFYSTPQELADMPSALFEARMEFLAADYALEGERLIMSTASVLRGDKEKEAE